MFIVINWCDYQTVAIVTNEDGTPKLFEYLRDAIDFSNENLNFKWRIVYLGQKGV